VEAAEQAGVRRIHGGATQHERRSQSKPFHLCFSSLTLIPGKNVSHSGWLPPVSAGDEHASSELTGTLGNAAKVFVIGKREVPNKLIRRCRLAKTEGKVADVTVIRQT
jgi:hypothetical protein